MKLDSYLDSFKGKPLTLVGPFAKREIEVSEPVLYIDRGADYRKFGLGFAIGDGDSARSKMDLRLNPDKDQSDLEFALSHVPSEFSVIHLSGFLGGRRDHELINLAVVHRFLKSRKHKTEVRFDQDIRALSSGSWTFSDLTLFSVFAFEPVTLLLEGCKYPLRGQQFQHLSSHGLSNQALGDVTLECDAPTFVF